MEVLKLIRFIRLFLGGAVPLGTKTIFRYLNFVMIEHSPFSHLLGPKGEVGPPSRS